MSNKNDKLIPNNRMEEYLNWLGGNTPKGDTLNPQNRQERFLEQIAVRLDNGTGGGGGSGFVELNDMEAAKEFAVAENEGKIAQYVGSSDEVDGSCEYVDRLTISVNEEVFKNKVKGIAPTALVDSTSYDGLYLTTDSVIDFSPLVGESEGGMYMFGIEDSESYTQPLFAVMAVPSFCESDVFPHMLVMFAPNFNGYPDGGQALFNCTEWIETQASGETIYMGVLYAADNGTYQGHPVTKGWHCNQGNLFESNGSKVLAVEGDGDITFLKSILFGLKENDGAGVYTFKSNGLTWTPSITEYGISVQGSAIAGDEIIVEYQGDGEFAVGKTYSTVYFNTNILPDLVNIEDGTILEFTNDKYYDGAALVIESGTIAFTEPQACEPETVVLYSVAEGWNAYYMNYVTYEMNNLTVTAVAQQDKWKDIISSRPLPTFEVDQKLVDRIEVAIDADKYISTVEGKGSETFTYDNGNWVVYGTKPGTSVDGTILSCESTIIYCNTLLDTDTTENLLEATVPEACQPTILLGVHSGGSGTSPLIFGYNAKSTYQGCLILADGSGPSATIFNGCEPMSAYVGGFGWLKETYTTNPQLSGYTISIDGSVKALADSLFSLTPFESETIIINLDEKGITVEGTPVNGDKLTIVYKDGSLEKYELYRVQKFEGSKEYKAGDIADVFYFDTTKVPDLSTVPPQESLLNLKCIILGEQGILGEGLYGIEDDGKIFIGTKLIMGSASGIPITNLVYTSDEGWLTNGYKLENPITIANSWAFQGLTFQSALNVAAEFVSKIPADEEPEDYYDLYKFYASPDQASGTGIALVDLGILTFSDASNPSQQFEVGLNDEQLALMTDNDYSILKVTVAVEQQSMAMYLPLIAYNPGHYGGSRVYSIKLEEMGMVALAQVIPDSRMAVVNISVGNRPEVKADSVKYIDYEPTEDNNDGLKFVVLSSEPSTYYNGYYYIITQ